MLDGSRFVCYNVTKVEYSRLSVRKVFRKSRKNTEYRESGLGESRLPRFFLKCACLGESFFKVTNKSGTAPKCASCKKAGGVFILHSYNI